MKMIFTNRIYNSLCSITISYGVIALINGVMAKTGYWLTTTQNQAMDVAVFVAISAVMSGLQYALFPGLKLPESKLFSKKPRWCIRSPSCSFWSWHACSRTWRLITSPFRWLALSISH